MLIFMSVSFYLSKDKILEDYQYFVGTQGESDVAYSGEEGKVFVKF